MSQIEEKSIIFLKKNKQNNFGCFKKNRIPILSKNTQNCFAYNSIQLYIQICTGCQDIHIYKGAQDIKIYILGSGCSDTHRCKRGIHR